MEYNNQTVIYHNPRCRKSREALKILQEKNEDFKIIYYLDEPPTSKELKDLLSLLNIDAFSLIRRGEAIFKEKFKGKELSENEWVQAMVDYPKLIERPIVLKNEKAVIGRPPERILDIL